MGDFNSKPDILSQYGSMSPLDWNQSRLDSHDFVESLRHQPSPCNMLNFHGNLHGFFDKLTPPGCHPLCSRSKL